MSNATNAAAKSLLIPSPFCIKMALIDASFRIDGIARTERRFDLIKRLEVRIEPPEHAVVNACFVKIRKLVDGEFGQAFALREYVAYSGVIRIALNVEHLSSEERQTLVGLLVQINQLGKRGCFVQLTSAPAISDGVLPTTFATELMLSGELATIGTLQLLDEMQQDTSLRQVDAYSDVGEIRGAVRKSVPTILRYRRIESSKGYTAYERTK